MEEMQYGSIPAWFLSLTMCGTLNAEQNKGSFSPKRIFFLRKINIHNVF